MIKSLVAVYKPMFHVSEARIIRDDNSGRFQKLRQNAKRGHYVRHNVNVEGRASSQVGKQQSCRRHTESLSSGEESTLLLYSVLYSQSRMRRWRHRVSFLSREIHCPTVGN